MQLPTRQPSLTALPSWLPDAAKHYLHHTMNGTPIRALARSADVHPSTILRQVRQTEQRREDILVDQALCALSNQMGAFDEPAIREHTEMHIDPSPPSLPAPPVSDFILKEQALRVLRRMSEAGAYLAVGREMGHGIIVRATGDDAFAKLGRVEVTVAQAMVLKNWISCTATGAKLSQYCITSAGRTKLKELMAAQENSANGFKTDADPADPPVDPLMHGTFTTAISESPLAGLARRRGRDGAPFLSRDLVAAGERLREDFELSEMMERPADYWLKFLGSMPTSLCYPCADDFTPAAARRRVEIALIELRPELAQVVLRSCCFLEGMEKLERHMGWSARSGKVVLRIALNMLIRHYAEVNGGLAAKIG